MSTSSGVIKSSDGWVELATNGQSFIFSVTDRGYDIFVNMSDTEPAEDDFGFRVGQAIPFVREDVDGKAWIRTDAPSDVRYVISTGVRFN